MTTLLNLKKLTDSWLPPTVRTSFECTTIVHFYFRFCIQDVLLPVIISWKYKTFLCKTSWIWMKEPIWINDYSMQEATTKRRNFCFRIDIQDVVLNFLISQNFKTKFLFKTSWIWIKEPIWNNDHYLQQDEAVWLFTKYNSLFLCKTSEI